MTPETCPERQFHGNPFRYCGVKGCGWIEPPAVPVVHPEPGDRLRDAMREAGAAIEDMKPGTRFDAVRAAWTSLGLDDAGKAQAFVIGVMIHAHYMRSPTTPQPPEGNQP